MPLRRVLYVVAGALLCAALIGPVAVAQASDRTIITTYAGFVPKIKKDENTIKTASRGYPLGRVRPLVHALNHEASDLHALVSRLSRDSASSARGATAKADIVKGLGMVATSDRLAGRIFQAANGGPVPPRKLKKAVSLRNHGRTTYLAGLKLLRAIVAGA